MRGKTRGHNRPARRGATATEFALLMPVLMLLLFGCIDFGRFAYTHIAVTNAARARAGFGAVNPSTTVKLGTWQAQTQQAVVNEMNQIANFNGSQLTGTVTKVTTGEPANSWRAQVDVSYPFTTLVSWPGIPSTVTLRRTVAMRGVR